MLSKLNLLPLLIIPLLTTGFVLREQIVEVPGLGPDRTAETLPPLEQFEIESAHTGAKYQIGVQLPHEYDPAGDRYPVFYTLQTVATPPMYDEIVAPLLRRGHVPDVIYVSISRRSPRGNVFAHIASRMDGSAAPTHTWTDDLTFYTDPRDATEGGGAEKFIAFLEHELIPRIDRTYHTDRGDRGIGGRDFGGSFAVEVSYRRAGLFERAIAITPRAHFADFALIDALRATQIPQRRRPVTRLYVGAGTDNYPAVVHGVELLQAALVRINTRSVALKCEMLRGRSGVNEVAPAAQSGLRFVYDE